MSDTKRKFPRRPYKKPVAYLCKGLSEVSSGVEIGEGGISFESDYALEVSQDVVVNFFVPDGDFFSLRALVKNKFNGKNGKTVYGCSFNEVSLGLKRQIRAYVARMGLSDASNSN